MNFNYSCKICDDYFTKNVSEITRHLSRQKQCMRSINSFNYSNDQLIILTLISNKDNNLKTKINKIDKNNDLIYKNKIEILDNIKLIDKQKLKKCTLCNKDFSKISELKEHFLMECFYKSKKEEVHNNIQISLIDSNNTTNNTTTNNTNSNNTINNNITNNIYLNIKNPIPFDNDWNISNIDKEKLIFSKIMYTNLLTEILKNEINLNVIIEKDNDSGIVYKNDIDKYIKMKSEDIIDKTMLKLKEHLLSINNDSQDYFIKDFLIMSKKVIEKKYDDYIENNDNLKANVSNIIKNIYNTKKDDALEVSKTVLNNDLSTIGY